MSTNLDGIVAKIRDVRAKKRPVIEANMQTIDKLLAALRDTRGKASTVATRYPDLAAALQGVSFNDAENRLFKARSACETALIRLRRESINIGVAAKAGQGKSQMLQMLTGLGNDQIPTGGGGACTAVRSIVHNSQTQKAIVHYLSPTALLEKKVYPSYAPAGFKSYGLGLPGKPASLEAFLSAPLSPVESADGLPTQGVNNWNDNVLPLQRALNAHPELKQLLGSAPEEIPMEGVRTFLVKDNNETKHNVVDYVELWTPFEVGLPEGLTVYDIPGLEDPTPGIQEDMLESVKNDADVVFFLLKPAPNGERTLWGPADNNATDMLKSVYPQEKVKPKDWIQLILNEDKRDGHKNGRSINLLLGRNADGTPSELFTSKIPKDFTPVVCDCGSKDAVRNMVDANIDALVAQTGRIDDLRIREADEAFSSAIDEAIALRNHLRSLTFDIINPDFDLDEHIEDFMSALRGPLREGKKNMDFFNVVKISLTNYFVQAKTKLNDYYQRYDEKDKFPEDFPIFSKHELFKLLQRRTGPVGALEDAVRTQRESILKLLRDQLSLCCGDLCNGYFEHVARLAFASNPALQNIVPAGIDSGPDKRHYIHQFLNAFRKTGTFPWLEKALESLLRFDLSFDNTILPWIYGIEHFADFDPDRKGEDGKGQEYKMVRANVSDKGSFQETADYIFEWMKQKTIMILEELTSPAERKQKLISGISSHVAHAMESNYDSFLYRFIWGKPVEKEWTRFADKNKTVFWRQEYEEAQANSQLKKDWDDALSNLAMQLADVH